MPTQLLTVVAIAGTGAATVEALFQAWHKPTAPDPLAIDHFCDQLRANATTLPVIYFCEWVDRWLMGDSVPGPDHVDGKRYQVACLRPDDAAEWAKRLGHQFSEQEWLASRLKEASSAWELEANCRVIVVIREVVGPSTTDDEVRDCLGRNPEWLSAGGERP